MTEQMDGERGIPLKPWTSTQWCDWFQRNARSLRPIPWERGAEITEAERANITKSVQEFQLGESGEGQHFFRCAQAYARRTGDHQYEAALKLFVREEQRHARDLGRFMKRAGIATIKRSWTDEIFRRLRHAAGLDLTISVLMTAEIIAKVYYRALRDATSSIVLQQLCEQILSDEKQHVRFQAERLALLRRGRSFWRLSSLHLLQRLLFTGACLVVWRNHKRVLRPGNFSFLRYWKAAWAEFSVAAAQMDPRCYSRLGANASLSESRAATPPARASAGHTLYS